jgi:nucleotide-binding universal stress UspA family protein
MGKIVVGIDGSDRARAALQWAIDEAALRGATVEAVHAWSQPLNVSTPLGFVPIDLGNEDFADDMAAVNAMVDSVDPNVEVHYVVGSASAAILAEAKDADLVVVGSRGHGGFAGLLLGSVSQQVVHHATVPVVVIPSAGD